MASHKKESFARLAQSVGLPVSGLRKAVQDLKEIIGDASSSDDVALAQLYIGAGGDINTAVNHYFSTGLPTVSSSSAGSSSSLPADKPSWGRRISDNFDTDDQTFMDYDDDEHGAAIDAEFAAAVQAQDDEVWGSSMPTAWEDSSDFAVAPPAPKYHKPPVPVAPSVLPDRKRSPVKPLSKRISRGSSMPIASVADNKSSEEKKAAAGGRMPVEEVAELYRDTLETIKALEEISADQMTSSHRQGARKVLIQIYQNLPPGDKAKQTSPSGPLPNTKECQVCFQRFGGDTRKQIMTHCGHDLICTDCYTIYIRTHINDEDVLPWLVCPHPECKIPLHPADVAAASVSPLYLYHMARIHIGKTLAQHEDWVLCKGNEKSGKDKCLFGFVVLEAGKKSNRACDVCGLRQSVEKKAVELDAEFKEMIRKGEMRDCPVCHFYTTKDYGICNVIQCAKCGIWWNWRNKETGSTYKGLKEKARMSGTLWEPGELAYQQKLERSDPKAFAALLEKNGQKYDPNYRRGAD